MKFPQMRDNTKAVRVSIGRSVAELVVRWTISRPDVNRSWKRRRFVTTADVEALVSHAGKTAEMSAGRTVGRMSIGPGDGVTTADADALVSHAGKTAERSTGRTSQAVRLTICIGRTSSLLPTDCLRLFGCLPAYDTSASASAIITTRSSSPRHVDSRPTVSPADWSTVFPACDTSASASAVVTKRRRLYDLLTAGLLIVQPTTGSATLRPSETRTANVFNRRGDYVTDATPVGLLNPEDNREGEVLLTLCVLIKQ
ncbi:hypothetical protein LSAT2_019716 [Lamellibrachia satsuma]|nr:hypothetical protein LSAT2_019716 [Lamellibrachia satsuma]